MGDEALPVTTMRILRDAFNDSDLPFQVDLVERNNILSSCDKRGNCCKCVEYHQKKNEIPGSFFTAAGEKNWDRSFANFVKDQGKG